METYWHEWNPWNDSGLIYIPIELCAALCNYSRSWSDEETVTHWRQYGDKLDCYILPQPSGMHSLGVRFGKEGHEYLSPYGNHKAIDALLKMLPDWEFPPKRETKEEAARRAKRWADIIG